MLNYSSAEPFPSHCFRGVDFSLCKWDLNPLSPLLLLINALQFLVIYFIRFLVDRSSQTINLIDVPHVHSSSFSLFSLVNDGYLRERIQRAVEQYRSMTWALLFLLLCYSLEWWNVA
jgi:hypothetical protein